jgi:hypothetical protein
MKKIYTCILINLHIKEQFKFSNFHPMKNKNEKKLEKNIKSLSKKEILSLKIDNEFVLLRKNIGVFFEETTSKIKKVIEDIDDNNME